MDVLKSAGVDLDRLRAMDITAYSRSESVIAVLVVGACTDGALTASG